MAALRSTSLRSQLSLTYAGIALLTALLLGGILLSVLAEYYEHAETAYLQAAAMQIRNEPLPDVEEMAKWAARVALVEQVRVRAYDADGELMADSGSPRDIGLNELDPRHDGPRDRPERRPQPLGDGLFGGGPSSGSASDATLKVAFANASGEAAGYLVLSEPPTSGRAVLVGIAQAWTVAALAAVALAALAGYLLSLIHI